MEEPGAWWRHAIGAVLRQCRAVRRAQMPLAALERRRRLRLQYQPLYAAACSVNARPSAPLDRRASAEASRGSPLCGPLGHRC